jgi:uncharacterized membrane protein
MPFRIITDELGAPDTSGAPSTSDLFEVELWPHRSLTPEGFVAMIGGSFAMLCIPLVGLLGTAALWGVLPFAMTVLGLLWLAMRRSLRDRDIHESLTVTPAAVRLVRRDPNGALRDWECNPFWMRVELHDRVGTVEDYLTLEGGPRSVELGAFLTPEERRDLRERLLRVLGRVKT